MDTHRRGVESRFLQSTYATLACQGCQRLSEALSVTNWRGRERRAQYYQTIDAGDSEAWANTFTSDGVFNVTHGHDALAESNRRGGGQNRPLRHVHTNLKITPTAEGASGRVYVFEVDITAKPPAIATYSRYDDTLVKTPQGWRFKTRQRSTDTTMARVSGQ